MIQRYCLPLIIFFQGNQTSGANFHGVPNIDHSQNFVRNDLIGWLKWLHNFGFQDFRFDFARG